jgi:hypothetical protein
MNIAYTDLMLLLAVGSIFNSQTWQLRNMEREEPV